MSQYWLLECGRRLNSDNVRASNRLRGLLGKSSASNQAQGSSLTDFFASRTPLAGECQKKSLNHPILTITTQSNSSWQSPIAEVVARDLYEEGQPPEYSSYS